MQHALTFGFVDSFCERLLEGLEEDGLDGGFTDLTRSSLIRSSLFRSASVASLLLSTGFSGSAEIDYQLLGN